MWNSVLQLVLQIKKEYQAQYSDKVLNLQEWIAKLNKEQYNNIFDCLQINQHNNLVLIRYGLAEMQKGMWEDENSIYRECRSLVIDLENECIALCSFRKFFNLNEVKENTLENISKKIAVAQTVEITDKLDGSMQTARYYNGDYLMAGSMALDRKNSWRLESGYRFLTDNYKHMLKDYADYTFIFEHISQQDAHIVSYSKEEEGLYLIGARSVLTGEMKTYSELIELANKYQIKVVKKEQTSLDEILSRVKTELSENKEGWVLNIDGHYVKIKCDDYVKLHRILDKVSSANVLIEAVANNTTDDILCKLSGQTKARVEEQIAQIEKIKEDLNNKIEQYYSQADLSCKKSFMLWVSNNVEKDLQGYVRMKYLNQKYNVLKTNKRYKKATELGL